MVTIDIHVEKTHLMYAPLLWCNKEFGPGYKMNETDTVVSEKFVDMKWCYTIFEQTGITRFGFKQARDATMFMLKWSKHVLDIHQ